jgi:hypothetical protein
MALTRDFRQTVQARAKCDPSFRQSLLSEAVERLLAGELLLGKELLRDYINATLGFPKLAAHTETNVKTLHQMFGPRGNPTASKLFGIVAYLQRVEGVHLRLRPARISYTKQDGHSPRKRRPASAS